MLARVCNNLAVATPRDKRTAAPCDPDEALRALLQPEFFRSLSDPTRLQVLHRLSLASSPQTVTEVAGCCGVHLSGVSRHLAALRDAGVVQAHKHGREVRYAIDCDRLSTFFEDLAAAFAGCAAAE